MIREIIVETLSERAYREVKESIMNNELLPNQVIPIGFLARSLGISRTPVREALARLSAEGLVCREAHRKPRVSRITETDVCQVYEVRRLLEPYLAGMMAAKISECVELREYLTKLRSLAEGIYRTPALEIDYQDFVRVDLQLDVILLQGAGDSLLGEILAFVGNRSLRVRTFVEQESDTALYTVIAKEHLEIIKLLLDGDREKSFGAVKQHLVNAEDRTLRAVRRKLVCSEQF